ncbi:FAS1 domain [Macleaya cordata]|uniref:ubiquitinyl hydrolase 1 n=1 Tax=Macleaya cordata TaxID=56857 RepID=A0A200R4J3_MACCD|nr:FAS1 domain [Macleaya cordata]
MEKTQIYHEKQRLQFCLLHALNNLFQEKDSFTRADLNNIADKLLLVDPNKEHQTWIPIFKPHHNAITGNYDINVLISALEQKGKTVVWHDRRNGASSIDLNRSEDILMGIVLNIPVRKFGGLWKSRHWVALRRIEGIWYNLDSDFKSPQPFKGADEVKEFLDFIISCGAELMEFSKKLRKNCSFNNSIAFVCLVVSVSCFVVVFISLLRLPEVANQRGTFGSYGTLRIRKVIKEEEKLGELGEMMVGMLPDDLAFTVFVPSVKAFEHDLKLWANDSLDQQKENDNTYATLSRILGFSAVPRSLLSVNVPLGKEVTFDSISGFKLYIWRDTDGTLVVNRIRSKQLDLRKREIVVHIMNGVIMDAEFEQSVRPDDEDED